MELHQGVFVPRVYVGAWVGVRRANSHPSLEFSHSCTHSSAQVFPAYFLVSHQVSSRAVLRTVTSSSDIYKWDRQWLLSRMDGLITASEHFQSFPTCHRVLELLPDLWISGTELALDLPKQHGEGQVWMCRFILAPVALESGWIPYGEAVLCPGRVLNSALDLCPLNVSHLPSECWQPRIPWYYTWWYKTSPGWQPTAAVCLDTMIMFPALCNWCHWSQSDIAETRLSRVMSGRGR